MSPSPLKKNLLITGEPACGKTTLIQSILPNLTCPNKTGFFTQEIRRQGKRLGFQTVGLRGHKALLAHVLIATDKRIGRYGIDIPSFEAFLEKERYDANQQSDLFVIDEIGKMECFSEDFITRTIQMLDSSKPVFGSIALGGHSFISKVRRRKDVQLIGLSTSNRQNLTTGLLKRVQFLISDRS